MVINNRPKIFCLQFACTDLPQEYSHLLYKRLLYFLFLTDFSGVQTHHGSRQITDITPLTNHLSPASFPSNVLWLGRSVRPFDGSRHSPTTPRDCPIGWVPFLSLIRHQCVSRTRADELFI